MNTEEFYRAKAIKQLKEKQEMRFRKNMNLCFLILVIAIVLPMILFWIFK